MKAQLIIDCGGRVSTALLVTPDGEIVPVSQEIRNVATRHVSTDVLFDPRVSEHPDFLWEDALESLSRARARDFFHRARRIGLRRPWDGQASADALRLASPIAVLSSAAALADRTSARVLPQFSLAILDALLEPAFAFIGDRKLAPADVDVTLVLPSWAGRAARNGLQKLVRRRGFRRATIVGREIAAALTLLEQPPGECIVFDATDDDLHVHRLEISGASARTIRTIRSSTLPKLGWSYWLSRIAAALGTTATPSLDRMLVALLSGSPESLPPLITSTVDAALDDAWIEAERSVWATHLAAQCEAVGAGNAPLLLVGEVFALDAVRRVFPGSAVHDSMPGLPAKGVALAMRWQAAEPARTLLFSSGGSLRLDTLHGETVELLDVRQLPAPGESCHVSRSFHFAGEQPAGAAFLVHLLWGTDDLPLGNTTLSAMPLEMRRPADGELHVTVQLRRSRGGALLHGTAEARAGLNAVAAQFTHELEVRR